MVLKPKAASFSIKKKTASLTDLLALKNIDKPSPGAYEQPIVKFTSSPSM